MEQAQGSFTLIELLVVLFLMVFLVSLAVPVLFDLDSYVLNDELEKLAIVIGYQQQRALVTNQLQIITLNILAHTYAYPIHGRTVAYKLSDRVQFGFIPSVLGPPGNPNAPITQPITFQPYTTQANTFVIVLFPNGNISPGALYIVDKRKKTMGALTCSVSRVSYIRRYLYQSNQWVLVSS